MAVQALRFCGVAFYQKSCVTACNFDECMTMGLCTRDVALGICGAFPSVVLLRCDACGDLAALKQFGSNCSFNMC